ncbi:MAG: cytochrome b/b6 domain-containing protein [Reyranellaceae bacterium]
MSERTTASPAPAPSRRLVRVWDLPTRLFHWALVVLVAFSWWSGENERFEWHFWSGYAILTLLIFRIVWGFVGSSTARFADFVRGPLAGLAHLRELLGRHEMRDVGHNAIGGWMVVALILALLVQAVTGLFADDAILTVGPLGELVSSGTREWLTDIHELLIKIILVMIGLHVLAVLSYLVLRRINLIGPMFTGRKALPADLAAQPPKMASSLLALAVLIVSGLIVWGIVSLGG